MSRAMDGWTTPHDGAELLGQMSRQIDLQDRRTRIPNAAQILGPGLGPRATLLADWNAEETTFNGIFYSDVGSLNSPNPAKQWIGLVQATAVGDGTMQLMEMDVADPEEWVRTFTANPSGSRTFTAWAKRHPHPTDGIWVNHLLGLQIPNVNFSAAYARYTTVGDTFTMQAAVALTTGAVAGQVLINMPTGFDWGPGVPYLISIGWTDALPIGKLRALRSGVSWYEGDIIPYSMRAGATPARASVWQPGVAGVPDGSSSGAAWQPTVPVAGGFQPGDRWGFELTTEIARY